MANDLNKKLVGTIVEIKLHNGGDSEYGIVEESDVVASLATSFNDTTPQRLFHVKWFKDTLLTSHYSAAFTEYEFYNTGNPNFLTRWDIALDGSASDQERLVFRIKHGA